MHAAGSRSEAAPCPFSMIVNHSLSHLLHLVLLLLSRVLPVLLDLLQPQLQQLEPGSPIEAPTCLLAAHAAGLGVTAPPGTDIAIIAPAMTAFIARLQRHQDLLTQPWPLNTQADPAGRFPTWRAPQRWCVGVRVCALRVFHGGARGVVCIAFRSPNQPLGSPCGVLRLPHAWMWGLRVGGRLASYTSLHNGCPLGCALLLFVAAAAAHRVWPGALEGLPNDMMAAAKANAAAGAAVDAADAAVRVNELEATVSWQSSRHCNEIIQGCRTRDTQREWWLN